jgi:hypothetical protein
MTCKATPSISRTEECPFALARLVLPCAAKCVIKSPRALYDIVTTELFLRRRDLYKAMIGKRLAQPSLLVPVSAFSIFNAPSAKAKKATAQTITAAPAHGTRQTLLRSPRPMAGWKTTIARQICVVTVRLTR